MQCKKLHVVDLSTKHHTVTSYAEKMKYPPKKVKSSQSPDPKKMISARSQKLKRIKRLHSGDPEQVISARSQDTDIHVLCAVLFGTKKFLPPVWLSPLERSEIQRQQYSHIIYHIRRETIYYLSLIHI